MRVLIDTHVFIWWTSDVKKLSARVHDLLIDPNTEAVLSVVSIWEMQIKSSLGKIEFTANSDQTRHKSSNLKVSPKLDNIWQHIRLIYDRRY